MADSSTPGLIRREQPDIKLHSDVTPSLHPQNVVALAQLPDGKLDPAFSDDLAPIQGLFNDAYTSLGHIHEARAVGKDDTALTPAALTLKLADLAEKHQTRITGKWDAALKVVNDKIKAMENQLDSGLKASSDRLPLAGEIRGHFLKLSVDKRIQMLDEAEKNGDIETLQAVLGGPGYLSGISEDFRKVRARLYFERKSPELTKRLGVLKAVAGLLESRGGNFLTEVPKAIGASWATVSKLRATASATERAFIMRTPDSE